MMPNAEQDGTAPSVDGGDQGGATGRLGADVEDPGSESVGPSQPAEVALSVGSSADPDGPVEGAVAAGGTSTVVPDGPPPGVHGAGPAEIPAFAFSALMVGCTLGGMAAMRIAGQRAGARVAIRTLHKVGLAGSVAAFIVFVAQTSGAGLSGWALAGLVAGATVWFSWALHAATPEVAPPSDAAVLTLVRSRADALEQMHTALLRDLHQRGRRHQTAVEAPVGMLVELAKAIEEKLDVILGLQRTALASAERTPQRPVVAPTGTAPVDVPRSAVESESGAPGAPAPSGSPALSREVLSLAADARNAARVKEIPCAPERSAEVIQALEGLRGAVGHHGGSLPDSIERLLARIPGTADQRHDSAMSHVGAGNLAEALRVLGALERQARMATLGETGRDELLAVALVDCWRLDDGRLDGPCTRPLLSLFSMFELQVVLPRRGDHLETRLHRVTGRQHGSSWRPNEIASIDAPGVRRGETTLQYALVRTGG